MAVKTKAAAGAKKSGKPVKPTDGRPTVGGPWLTTEEAAAMIGLRPKTLHNWRAIHEPDRPKAHVFGRRVWYKQSDVQLWMDAHKET